MNADTAPAGSPWPGRIRRTAIGMAALVAVLAVLGFFAVPSIVKSKLEAYVTESTGRKATLGKVEFNPFTMRGRLTDFTLAHRASDQALFHFDALDLDVSAASLWRLAPVFNALRLTRPTVTYSRNADGTYDIQDLIDALFRPSDAPTPQFSLNNIEIEGGTVSLDDRLHRRKVALANLAIGIPFLSSLPHDAEIRVNPHFEGTLDGARFTLKGTMSTPFANRKEAAVDIEFDALALAGYVQYVPLPQGLKLAGGTLTTRLKLAFASEKGEPRSATLSGTARLDGLAVTRGDGSPLVGARSIAVAFGKLDPIGHAVVLDSVSVEAPDVDLRRGGDGVFEFQRLLTPDARPASSAGTTPAARAGAAPWTYSVADLNVAGGTVRVADEGVSPAFRVALSNVRVVAKKIASNGDPATVEADFDAESGAHYGATGNVDLAKGEARGHFALTKLRLASLYPYYADAVNLDVQRGELDLAGDFDAAWTGTPPQLTLAQGSATIADLDLAVRGERDPLWRVPHGDLSGIAFDLARRSITIDRIEARPVSLRIGRQQDGVVNFQRLLRASEPSAAPPANAPATAAQGGAEWSVVVKRLVFERMAANFEDQVPQPSVKLQIPEGRIVLENFSNVRGAKGTVDFTARIGSGGRAHAIGMMATRPFAIDWKVDVDGVDFLPLKSYFEVQTNVILTSGAVSAKGRVTAGALPAGTGAGFSGDVTIRDFGALDRPTAQELMRWKTLTFTGLEVTETPPKVALGAIGLDQFFARLIVNPDATLNLQRLLVPPDAQSAAAVPAPPPPPSTPASTAASAPASTPPPVSAPTPAPTGTPASQETAVSIGDIKVSHGEVQFSDFYIKPNYSAHLTEVTGSVSALSATQAGKVEVAARVENIAPVEVRGTVNPFARELSLDLTAKATGIDLPPLTTYSGKYAGYGITKGALSFEVHYQIDKRRLTASNKLVLDQLTFGERVDSPTATKLPILLAVALLKDGNGTIRLDLPIQGSLDDPEFSVWGVVVQIIVNLIAKAATAPFALLGAIAGSHADELAFVEFAPGRADLSPSAEAKLQSLAKALSDRPALKLDIAGRVLPDADRDGLKHVALDRAMRAQKQKALVAKGESAASLDALTIDATEYPTYLAAVYDDTKLPDKPRNVIGLAKDIPPAEMESMLLASYSVDDEALRALANRRAETVKEWFAGKGGIASERMFVVAPKLTADGYPGQGGADARRFRDPVTQQLVPSLRGYGLRAMKSISTSALRASPVTPTHVRAGSRLAGKYER